MVKKIWENLIELDTMEECKNFINGGNLQDEEKKELRFAWHTSAPGDGRTRAYYKCISHEDCPVLVRAVKLGGTFAVQVTAEEQHSIVEMDLRRINASMSVRSAELVKSLVDGGSKPGAIFSVLTSKELEQSQGDGIAAVKRPNGGLKGEPPHAW